MKMPLSIPIASAEIIEKFVLFFLKSVILVAGISIFWFGLQKFISNPNFLSFVSALLCTMAGISLVILFAVINCKK